MTNLRTPGWRLSAVMMVDAGGLMRILFRDRGRFLPKHCLLSDFSLTRDTGRIEGDG